MSACLLLSILLGLLSTADAENNGPDRDSIQSRKGNFQAIDEREADYLADNIQQLKKQLRQEADAFRDYFMFSHFARPCKKGGDCDSKQREARNEKKRRRRPETRNRLTSYSTGKSCTCGMIKSFRKNRIIGGSVAEKNAYPWMVRIINGCGSVCTGALISRRHIATAFHCLQESSMRGTTKLCAHSNGESKVIIGAHVHDVAKSLRGKIATDGEVYAVKKFLFPPDPTPDENNPESHDFAIIVLDQPLELSENVMPICLPKRGDEDFEGDKAIAAGWGDYRRNNHPNSKELRHVELTVSKTLRTVPKLFTTITEKSDDGEWKDPCSGDSGGPLMKRTQDDRMVLIGTVYGGGYNCDKDKITEGFGDKNQKWNKITAHLKFIKNVLRSDDCAFDY